MKKFFISALLVFCFSGCATTGGYEQMLGSWVGVSDRELIEKWGAPDAVYEFDSTQKVVTYHQAKSVYFPGTSPTFYASRVGDTVSVTPVGGTPGQLTNYSCKTDFTIENHVVTKWRWEGNNCLARKKKTGASSQPQPAGSIHSAA